MNPPQDIRAIVKKHFRNEDDLLAESRRILSAGAGMKTVLDTAEGKETIKLFTWIGGLRHSHSLTNRARTFFKDQAALYQKALNGQVPPQNEIDRLLVVLGQMQDNDIKDVFLEGYYKP